MTTSSGPNPGDSRLAERLRRAVEGEVLFDAYTRGRYATDASIYQIEPLGVVVPKKVDDISAVLDIAREEGVPVLPRGGGTSQCGQTVGRAIVVDTSRHLARLLSVDETERRCWVEPGVTLDQLNRQLKARGLWFPVDISTGSRATLGGMAGNNSCGSRSIRYGNMVHNVRAIDCLLADGTTAQFGETPEDLSEFPAQPAYRALIERSRAIVDGVADELASERWPRLLRRVGGYNLDMIRPHRVPGLNRNEPGHNMAKLLVGSEGTLGFFTRLQLDLAPIPRHKALGVCHFPTFYQAMDATRHIVKLDPDAVELVDRTMIELARDIAMFRPVVDRFVQGEPDAVLLVEFAGDDEAPQLAKLKRLVELMADLGFPGSVVEATDPAFQSAIWEVRKQGLNIMMSMKGDGKPVSFIEDCAVPLEHLAEYTRRLDEVFQKYGTKGTWYAHASVGTLHVRPIVNLKEPDGARKMRAIAEETFAIVREYQGSHSGEHGDGLVRSEFHRQMFGDRLVGAFEDVKDAFDPNGLFNPGKIVRPSKMDDRSLHRFPPGYAHAPVAPALDWSAWGSFGHAAEMCNNNGECRKFDAGVMCPSYRATRDERHVTRGRANTLRLALSGQLGPDALASDAMAETMELCVGCKGCKRECPTGVDMARMKIEVRHARNLRHGLSARGRMVAFLPRYAPWAARLGGLMNLRDVVPGLGGLTQSMFGLAAGRSLPRWHGQPFRDAEAAAATTTAGGDKDVVLLVDTFTRWFEPENARAALKLLGTAGYRVHVAADDFGRPLCCGRTFLAEGLVEQARAEAGRMLAALKPHVEAGRMIVGLEPSCLFTLKDEFLALGLGADAEALAASAHLIEPFLLAEKAAGRLDGLRFAERKASALVHGHCHQKAFGVASSVLGALALVPGLDARMVESSCCGMAGAFGYEAEHVEVSMAMAEAALLPAVRAATPETLIVADGAGRPARHAVRILAEALA